ncbi:hypothetical protein BGW36DRAFT_425029 [Talaromyces proteolyticus]|uniref:Uncharacterized protein n=1 Tax=Talaromyces proteolyticus TaxID=1131652 RepID=A0AAD4KY61_9EURO|nr:uncharacterized protein BGW36DRAFT_425029 [Talaromyces proteolyticus]KAH8700196.1 hypothetical protein BGW36DRAFT_425029 [Talaromyces proteolyticus]
MAPTSSGAAQYLVLRAIPDMLTCLSAFSESTAPTHLIYLWPAVLFRLVSLCYVRPFEHVALDPNSPAANCEDFPQPPKYNTIGHGLRLIDNLSHLVVLCRVIWNKHRHYPTTSCFPDPLLLDPTMATHEDVQKSSSMPSTPQSLMFLEADNHFHQPTNEEIWRNAKRRRTQRTSSETQFIHMNGYKSDSQVGTRFNNTYVDSYADSKTYDSVHHQSADAISTSESSAPAIEPSKPSEERSEPVVAKPTRTRRPVERSTETSSRVLKVKSGSGSSQQTNIQTFIFKTKLDPRLAHQAHSDDTADNDQNDYSAKRPRKSRKADGNTLKFKSYNPNLTPRNATRKPSRQDPPRSESVATTPAQKSPTLTIDEYYPTFAKAFDHEKEKSPQKSSQFETPSKGENMDGSSEVGSTQRRSTRIRKPTGNILNGDTPINTTFEKAGFAPPTKEEKPVLNRLDVQMDDASSVNVNINSLTNPYHTTPSTPVSESEIPNGARDETTFETGTPSPESLSATTRTSGRLRKPTIKAIEALQSKPRSRKRLRDSDQHIESTMNGKRTPEPANAGDLSSVSMSRSTSGAVSEVMSMVFDDPDTIGRQLYELAAAAFADAPTAEDDHAKVIQLREAFNKNKTQQALITITEAPVTEQIEVDFDRIEQLGELNPQVPLEHPENPRPWIESDGWTHTGRVNGFGEEYCTAPTSRYQWVKHVSNYRTPPGPIPTPPPFVKSVQEIKRDNIFGFPPSPGQRNLYQKRPGQIWRHENVDGLLSHNSTRASAETSGVDATDADGETMSTPLFKKPIRLVLVDSSKLGHGRSRISALRRRRQSAPISGQKSAYTPTHTTTSHRRKRSLGDISIDMKDAVLDDADASQRKKRRSALKLERNGSFINMEEKTPGRNKPKYYKTQATPESKSTGPKGTPKGRRSAVRTVHSEKPAHKTGAFTPATVHHPPQETPTHTGSGRGRRRTLGASK